MPDAFFSISSRRSCSTFWILVTMSARYLSVISLIIIDFASSAFMPVIFSRWAVALAFKDSTSALRVSIFLNSSLSFASLDPSETICVANVSSRLRSLSSTESSFVFLSCSNFCDSPIISAALSLASATRCSACFVDSANLAFACSSALAASSAAARFCLLLFFWLAK